MSTKELLIAARAKIADPKNWTQRAYARDAKSESVSSLDADAVCWCAAGAVRWAGGDSYGGSLLSDRAWGELLQTAHFHEDSASMFAFNDTHTNAEVLALFDKTIERLSEND